MNGLYPIIRRVRRPLVPVEPLRAASTADASALPGGQQAAPVRVEKSGRAAAGERRKSKEQHGEIIATEPAQ